MDKKSFLLYNDYRKHLDLIDDDREFRLLIEAVFDYHSQGITPKNLSPLAKMAFSFMQTNLDRDIEKYNKICERNKENIKKRYSTKATSGRTGIPNLPEATKSTDNDTDTDTDNDNDTDNDTSLVLCTKVHNTRQQVAPVDASKPDFKFYFKKVPEWYNNILSDCPKCTILTPQRKTAIKARHASLKTSDGWVMFFHWINESDFLIGKAEGRQDKPFVCNLDWVLKSSNFTKIIEGNYHEKDGFIIYGVRVANYYEFVEAYDLNKKQKNKEQDNEV